MGRGTRWIAREVASGLAAPAMNVVADGAEHVMAAQAAGQSMFRGGRGSLAAYRDGRGTSGDAVMGGELAHGGADRRNALARIGVGFESFRADVVLSASLEHDAQWIETDLAPALAEWQEFVGRMARSSLIAYVTKWSVFERWWDRLHRLRQAARARGIHLASPEPTPLPKTVWQRGADGTGSSTDAWISLGRKAFFGALAVAGAVGLYATIRKVRADLHRLRSHSSASDSVTDSEAS